MTNNGHNPLVAGGGPELEIGVSANWAKSFITPLLDPNSNFNKDKDGNPIRSLIFLSSYSFILLALECRLTCSSLG